MPITELLTLQLTSPYTSHSIEVMGILQLMAQRQAAYSAHPVQFYVPVSAPNDRNEFDTTAFMEHLPIPFDTPFDTPAAHLVQASTTVYMLAGWHAPEASLGWAASPQYADVAARMSVVGCAAVGILSLAMESDGIPRAAKGTAVLTLRRREQYEEREEMYGSTSFGGGMAFGGEFRHVNADAERTMSAVSFERGTRISRPLSHSRPHSRTNTLHTPETGPEMFPNFGGGQKGFGPDPFWAQMVEEVGSVQQHASNVYVLEAYSADGWRRRGLPSGANELAMVPLQLTGRRSL